MSRKLATKAYVLPDSVVVVDIHLGSSSASKVACTSTTPSDWANATVGIIITASKTSTADIMTEVGNGSADMPYRCYSSIYSNMNRSNPVETVLVQI
ncbi:MAG: hypothetical protein F4140_07035 [Cenarchaeum sp. SB0675_bin_21]|nr:hypothetical protein [Cenarchaeum sp. SB0675_bin_21]